jgi:hypothetical protein
MGSRSETELTKGFRQGVRIEVITVIWMGFEMAIWILAGIAAGSVLLIAFGLDSLIELVSGAILLWRPQVESRGQCGAHPAGGISRRLALVIMPYLAVSKRRASTSSACLSKALMAAFNG